jgi:hypothetical protein
MVMVGQLQASPALLHRTSSRYPWNRRLCWSKIQYGRYGERSSSLLLPVIEARFPGCRHCPNCRRPWTRHQCSTVYAAEAIHSSERPWCCCSAAVPQVGLVGAPKLNWKARSKLPLYAPMFDLILRENGGRSFCFQNAAFSIQTNPPRITGQLQLGLMGPQGAFLRVLKVFLWFYSQFPVAMLIVHNCPSHLSGSNQALHISLVRAGFTVGNTDHATWRIVTGIRRYELMCNLP